MTGHVHGRLSRQVDGWFGGRFGGRLAGRLGGQVAGQVNRRLGGPLYWHLKDRAER